MRHIFHTCLLAVRLITSVVQPGAKTADLDLFTNALLNRAFTIVFYDPGIYTNKSAVNYYVEQTKTA